jgi:replicative DNA helicase
MGLKHSKPATKQLEKLEAGYAKAKEKRSTISAAQQKAYELKRDELSREIERFKQIPSNLWSEVQSQSTTQL